MNWITKKVTHATDKSADNCGHVKHNSRCWEISENDTWGKEVTYYCFKCKQALDDEKRRQKIPAHNAVTAQR